MKPLAAACALLALTLARPAPAAPVAELAADLGYLRVGSLVEERATIQAVLAQPRALVLDLRQPVDERDAGETLRQLLAGHPATPRLYVLVSPTTPVPVVGAIAASPTPLVTLGIKGARPEPQVVVVQTAEADRAAYTALAGGALLADLVSGKVEKDRYDEAALVQEFKGGNHDARPPEPAATTPATTAPARLTDRVLQRALHLHRALQALKR